MAIGPDFKSNYEQPWIKLVDEYQVRAFSFLDFFQFVEMNSVICNLCRYFYEPFKWKERNIAETGIE